MNHTLEFDSDLSAIAVVGMAGRFPGAGTLSEFWINLSNGKVVS